MSAQLADAAQEHLRRLRGDHHRLERLHQLQHVGAKVRRLLAAQGYDVWPAEEDLRWRAWIAKSGDARLRGFLRLFEEKLVRRLTELGVRPDEPGE